MTRLVLRTTIRKKLGESTAVFWADSELNQWMEDAQLDVAWKVRCKRQKSLVDTTANTVQYTLSSLIPNVLRIYKARIYNSSSKKWEPLTYITEDELDRDYEGWELVNPDAWVTATAYEEDDEVLQGNLVYKCLVDHTSGTFATDLASEYWEEVVGRGSPQYYAYDTELDEFILYPVAGDDYVGSGVLKLYNCPKPTPMSTDSSTPDLPETLHPAVIDYVVATGLESRGYADIADSTWGKYAGKLQSYLSQKDIEENEEIIMRPM